MELENYVGLPLLSKDQLCIYHGNSLLSEAARRNAWQVNMELKGPMVCDGRGILWRLVVVPMKGTFYFDQTLQSLSDGHVSNLSSSYIVKVDRTHVKQDAIQLRPFTEPSFPPCRKKMVFIRLSEVVYDRFTRPIFSLWLAEKTGDNKGWSKTFFMMMGNDDTISVLHTEDNARPGHNIYVMPDNTVLSTFLVCGEETQRICIRPEAKTATVSLMDNRDWVVILNGKNWRGTSRVGGGRMILDATHGIGPFFKLADCNTKRIKSIRTLIRTCHNPIGAMHNIFGHLSLEILKWMVLHDIRWAVFEGEGSYLLTLDAVARGVKSLLMLPPNHVCCDPQPDKSVFMRTCEWTFRDCVLRDWCGDYYAGRLYPDPMFASEEEKEDLVFKRLEFDNMWRKNNNIGRWHLMYDVLDVVHKREIKNNPLMEPDVAIAMSLEELSRKRKRWEEDQCTDCSVA